MLERMFKKKVYSKCKAYARLTRTRLETIRKKRNAVEKFLKKDIVDLLSSNLDYNAYGRAEGLLVEQNMSSCYELIEKYIECILDHAKELYDQGDCPEECKEAIPSLIYAAARFSDLPELRDLRTLFTAKYGASLEPYLSKEFVKKLRKDPPSKEMKIQLLSDLAEEFSIRFDSKALEQKLQSLPPLSVSHEFQGKAKDDAGNNDTEKSNDGSKISNNKGSDEDGSNKRRTLSFNVVPPPYYVTEKNNAENIMVYNNNNNNNTATAVATSEKDSSKPKPRSMRRIKPNPPPYDNGQSMIRRTISDSCDTKTETTTTSNSVGRSTSLSSHPRLPDYDDISARLAALRRAHNH
ncbi:uncharacterized protein LOC107459711 isoform X1 [Arachis duranensis]|uniref:Uncharacterized protein LOC107459711 isoform X1 n=1 Tax=Arachis duranensis TaxID=130453 RepID=A0A6P4B3Q2_ARADU|nr:uncharacterized protein LOC107459711 isoform X1 [Arachis duranensis]